MSKFQSKIVLSGRNDLSEVIPLPIPFVVQIDPANVCNFKCKFCPSGNEQLRKKNGQLREIMNFDLFKRIIDNLTEFDAQIKCIKLWKDGEPLLNHHIGEMIKYIKLKEVSEKVELTTNGYLLNQNLSDKLIESGLDRIIISIEGITKEKYSEVSGVDIDFDGFLKNIRYLFEHRNKCIVHVKIVDTGLTQEDKDTFFKLFNGICDEYFIEKVVPCWPGFENDCIHEGEVNVWGRELVKKEVCPLPFYFMSINANGNVGVCCNDWEQKILLGNVKEKTLKEIWNGDELRKFQILQLLKKRRSHDVCKQCMYPDYVSVDYLDDVSEKVFEESFKKKVNKK
ncbi:radical SAM/SPASM domain-containing protein [Clostridium hydrogenum]|uniref:radical SAM/SPASM domain-containing protein n=1 Tax=Clostridium hydrogenum TaxID=2855764 RepID=UPI001F431C2C|nr:radical SAM/SPASM domain-containing protein [Clostridium hydrogenum]